MTSVIYTCQGAVTHFVATGYSRKTVPFFAYISPVSAKVCTCYVIHYCFCTWGDGNHVTSRDSITHTWHIPRLTLHGNHNDGLTIIPACISNHTLSKVWDEIAHPFPNFNSFTVEFLEWMNNFIPYFMMGVSINDWLNSFISSFLTKYNIIKQKWTYTHNHIKHSLIPLYMVWNQCG